MRKVFESRRIENVEAVAAMLDEHGIETRIHGGRGWRGAIRGNFSYREHAPQREQPTLWVVNSNEQTRAREILREAGLIRDAQDGRASYVPATVHGGGIKGAAPRFRGHHLRVLLIVAVAVIAGMSWFGNRARAPQPVASAPAAAAPAEMVIAGTPAPYQAAMPTALAMLLVEIARDGASACVSVDGADPSSEWLAEWPTGNVVAASTCTAEHLRIEVGDYRTDGMGEGTASLVVHTAEGARQAQLLRVQREGTQWTILGEATATE